MPGVIEVRRGKSIPIIVEDILLLREASQPDELEGQVIYVPISDIGLQQNVSKHLF